MANTITSLPAADQQTLVDYLNAIATVTAWSTQVTQCLLPPLLNPPAGYADFAEQLVPAKMDALSWTQSVLFLSNQIPTSLGAFDPTVQSYSAALNAALGTLGTDPTNAAALASARAALQDLSGAFGGALRPVSGLITSLAGFSKGVTADTKTLNEFAAIAASAVGADSASIAQLNAVIKQFQESIANQNLMMTLEKLAAWDLNLFLAVAGTGVGLIFGPAGVVIGTLFGVATATVVSFYTLGSSVIIDPDVLADMQTSVTNMNSEVGELNSQIALVQTTATTFAAVVTEGTSVSAGIATVTAFWTNLQASLTTAFDSTTAAQQALAAKDIPAVGQRAAAAMAAWASVQTWCAALQGINVNITPQPVLAPQAPQG